jgi:hypothetical protein
MEEDYQQPEDGLLLPEALKETVFSMFIPTILTLNGIIYHIIIIYRLYYSFFIFVLWGAVQPII